MFCCDKQQGFVLKRVSPPVDVTAPALLTIHPDQSAYFSLPHATRTHNALQQLKSVIKAYNLTNAQLVEVCDMLCDVSRV